ncbi:hypothetical protein [Oscillibacter sp.]|uniref:hypothetical protein n=1 Tax=Oscillibacter sp. TaxID=1945593 RepID=UPI002898A9FC|nr:hypothetical protein [Oscillibacter sp.]
MANTIRISTVDNMSGYFEFDYKNPVINQRVRRKIKATQYQADLLKDLLDTILEQNLDKEHMSVLVRTNSFYKPKAEYLEKAISALFYDYCEKCQPNVIERNEAKDDLLNEKFSLSDYDARFCILGKAGVGKSTLIKKISSFWGNSDISFPFTDTSRTSTFPADYCFVHKQNGYRFLAVLKPSSIIELNTSECIERAVDKLIDLSLSSSNVCEMDAVFNAFVNDPAQTFDIRYSVGRYIKVASPARNKAENESLLQFWDDIFNYLKQIVSAIVHAPGEQSKESSYYQLVYSDAIKLKDEGNVIYQAYQRIMGQIKARMDNLNESILSELRANNAIKRIDAEIDDALVPYFSCDIEETDNDDFYRFIRLFTTKNASQFGHSFFNQVAHLRVELPLNPKIKLPQKGFTFVLQDTIGIAHANDGNGGFENSTNLQMGDVDAVVLMDDARLNGDNNMTGILRHLVARIALNKLHFAFSFFDDLIKQDFDSEDDLRSQRILYLVSTESNTIHNVISDPKQAQFLTDRLNSRDTFFLSELMAADKFDSVNELIEGLISNVLVSKSGSKLWKSDPGKEFVSYDFKKIPSFYNAAVNEYFSRQNQIYRLSPPHYKTTEALTNRLSNGVTYFIGARTLRPVDDLFDCLVKSLETYIENPAEMNFNPCDDETISKVIGDIKTGVTENLRNELNRRFLSPAASAEWQKLYLLSGTGSDRVRRDGVISTERDMVPDLNAYLCSTVQYHIVDQIEVAFKLSIASTSRKFFECEKDTCK